MPEWSLEVVLAALKKPPYYDKDLLLLDLKYLTQRTVFLVVLTTARRASEVHAFTASDIKFSADHASCISTWISCRSVTSSGICTALLQSLLLTTILTQNSGSCA